MNTKETIVLLVEDNKTNAILVAQILKNLGLKSALATNGYEALEMTKRNAYSLILMDISMPDLNGMETTQKIRKLTVHNNKKIPIIAISAHSSPEQFDLAKRSGMNDYIVKPFKIDNFYRIINKYLNLSRLNNEEQPLNDTVMNSKADKDSLRKYYDLSYFEKNGISLEDQKKLISLYIQDSLDLLNKIENSFSVWDVISLKHFAHKLKTNTSILGIHSAFPFIKWTEQILVGDLLTRSIEDLYHDFHQSVSKALKSLQKDNLQPD